MVINLQFFGGRGGSSGLASEKGGSRGTGRGGNSLDALKRKADSLSAKTKKYYANVAKDALDASGSKYDSYTDAERTKIRKTWQKYGEDARNAENKYYEELNKANQKKASKKTFVNGYGEATRREITTQTYKRGQKNIEKAVRRNLGY